MFMCRACLIFKNTKDKSFDERYCNDCCTFLLKEAKNYASVPRWVPKDASVKARKKDMSVNGKIKRLQKVAAIAKKGRFTKTTQTTTRRPVTKNKVVTLPSIRELLQSQDVTINKPDEMLQKIIALKEAGYKTTREIGKVLKVSHMTVARKLAGQRNLL